MQGLGIKQEMNVNVYRDIVDHPAGACRMSPGHFDQGSCKHEFTLNTASECSYVYCSHQTSIVRTYRLAVLSIHLTCSVFKPWQKFVSIVLAHHTVTQPGNQNHSHVFTHFVPNNIFMMSCVLSGVLVGACATGVPAGCWSSSPLLTAGLCPAFPKHDFWHACCKHF